MKKFVIFINGEETETFEAENMDQAESYMVEHYARQEAIYGDGSVEVMEDNE